LRRTELKIEIPAHNLYLVLHSHKHGVSYHFFALPAGDLVCTKNFEPFLEDFDPDMEGVDVIGPITIDDVKFLDLNNNEEETNNELAQEAGMLYGIEAYNEARGYDTTSPEPCGHHCQSDCPRCGRE
jgi:hypothetical protein